MRADFFLVKIFALLILLSGQVFAAPDFLPPEKAFRVEASWLENANQIEIELIPAKGYYIYQESLKFQAGARPGNLHNIRPALPSGIEKFDETFQKKLQIYKQPFMALLDVKPITGKPIYAEVTLQGCAEAGICYPPMTLKFLLAGPGVKAAPLPEILDGVKASVNASVEFGLADLWRERDDINAISRFLESTAPGYLFLAFFVLGLALAFTPCVLPMLPILSSVIFGSQGGKTISKGRASLLALSYVLGMAMVYALAGTLMAALGGSVQRALQSPVALAAFALYWIDFPTWLGSHGLYIEDICVTKELRGQGIGSALMSYLAQICVARGYARLAWWIKDDNESAIKFYENAGADIKDDFTVRHLTGHRLKSLATRNI